MTTRTIALTLGILSFGGSAATAQMGISLRASTLGAGGELSFRPNRYLGFRVAANYLRFTRNATIDGISYDVTPKLENGGAFLDLHPLGSALHLTGGVVRNSNEGQVVAQLTGPITIGGSTYQPSDVGTLTGRFSYSSRYVPYAGVGFSGRSRVSLLFDVGLVFAGYPQASLTGSTNLTGQAKAYFDANVQQEVQQIQDDINRQSVLKYYPVVALGLRFAL
jgi:hypothetical protein